MNFGELDERRPRQCFPQEATAYTLMIRTQFFMEVQKHGRRTCHLHQQATPQNQHEGITHLGGGAGADQWTWSRQKVINSIEDGSNTFHTFEGGKRANIGVVDGPNGKYLRTYADGQWNDNLLSLPECPG